MNSDSPSNDALPVDYVLSADSREGGAGFRIVRVLGMGGFGITYEAEWQPFGVTVAVKEYLPSGIALRNVDGVSISARRGTSAEHYQYGLKSFEDEARTLLQFKEPTIVRVVNYFQANGTAYLIMDFEAGETLAQMVDRRGPIPEEELEGILLRTLDGLHAIHSKGYLHRDIKPSNILVRADGRPLLIDFGAARQALGEKTQTLSVILTPGYAPFEQYLSRGKQGAWTDLYALGATLYRCISPDARIENFSSADRAEALHAGEPDPLLPAETLGRDRYSRRMLELLDWMLKVRGADRPQSAREAQSKLLARPAENAAPRPSPQSSASAPDPAPNPVSRAEPSHTAAASSPANVEFAEFANTRVQPEQPTMAPERKRLLVKTIIATVLLLLFGVVIVAIVKHESVPGFVLSELDRAEAGDVEAQKSIAMYYDIGLYFDKDDEESTEWYRKAAESGDAEAEATLGNRYLHGEGVSQDYQTGHALLKSARDKDSPLGFYYSGAAYESGFGVDKDDVAACDNYWRAALLEYSPGQYELGKCFAEGRGVERDEPTAISWFMKAAEQDLEVAKEELAKRGLALPPTE